MKYIISILFFYLCALFSDLSAQNISKDSLVPSPPIMGKKVAEDSLMIEKTVNTSTTNIVNEKKISQDEQVGNDIKPVEKKDEQVGNDIKPIEKKDGQGVTSSSEKLLHDCQNFLQMNVMYASVAYSKIAPVGKISVFVLSTPWCGPCIQLKEQLAKKYKNNPNINLYAVSMGTMNEDSLYGSRAYHYLQTVENLSGFPRVVICAPTSSVYKEFSYNDLIKECKQEVLYKEYVNADTLGKDINLTTIDFSACNEKDLVFHNIERIVEKLSHAYQVYFDKPKVITAVKYVKE